MDLLLLLRVALSLACVLGLLWFASKRMSGTAMVRRQRTTPLAVVGRQSLGGKAGLALVEVGGRRLLLGVSEHGVNLLTEVEVAPEPEADVAERTTASETRDELDADALTAAALELSWDTSPDDVAEGDDAPPAENLSTPAARMPAVPKPRSPLEGSILHAATWRQAMVAVQERTLRH